jgi:hypothetical protein
LAHVHLECAEDVIPAQAGIQVFKNQTDTSNFVSLRKDFKAFTPEDKNQA